MALAKRAHTTVVLAMSVDGKIADRDRSAARFSSPADLRHLEARIAEVDGVLFGASTLRAYGTCLPVRQTELLAQRQIAGQPAQPAQIVCSQSGQIDRSLRFFRQGVPRWLLTTVTGANLWDGTAAFEQILPLLTAPMDWTVLLQQFYGLGMRRLALLGGGTLIAALVEQDLVDELYLTVCPLILGGATAPTPVDGQGVPVAIAPRLALVQANSIDNEVFLHYRRYPPAKD